MNFHFLVYLKALIYETIKIPKEKGQKVTTHLPDCQKPLAPNQALKLHKEEKYPWGKNLVAAYYNPMSFTNIHKHLATDSFPNFEDPFETSRSARNPSSSRASWHRFPDWKSHQNFQDFPQTTCGCVQASTFPPPSILTLGESGFWRCKLRWVFDYF